MTGRPAATCMTWKVLGVIPGSVKAETKLTSLSADGRGRCAQKVSTRIKFKAMLVQEGGEGAVCSWACPRFSGHYRPSRLDLQCFELM